MRSGDRERRNSSDIIDMKQSQIYIDGADAYKQFGIFVTQGSYNNLVNFPASKQLDSNDWPEEDGQEFDLSSISLSTGEVSVELGFLNHWKFSDFVTLLSDKAHHEFEFKELGRTYRLRLASQNSFELFTGLNIARFTFVNDFPREAGYVYQIPVDPLPLADGYELDGRDFADYGVLILEGSDAEIRKSPSVKKNMLQEFKRQDGAVYDGEVVKFQTKEVALRCLMRAKDTESFWRNRDALLHDLTKLSSKKDSQGYEYSDVERSLYYDEYSESYPCYYKSCQTNELKISGEVWWEFTLILVFTGFRLYDTDYLLADEAGELIMTEDGMFYIDIKDYAD